MSIDEVRSELAPNGVLRAGINMSNFLLVTGQTDAGDPAGVSPDLAAEVARRLSVDLKLVPYPNPGALADAAEADEWDIGNIGAEPQRAEKIAFTDAYCEIEATYLVPEASPFTSIAAVDSAGIRIAVMGRAAYGLWLENNIQSAELVQSDSYETSFADFSEGRADVLAALRPKLLGEDRMPGAKILDGRFMAVQQAIGTPRKNTAAAAWLKSFIEEITGTEFIADLIKKHGADGLSAVQR